MARTVYLWNRCAHLSIHTHKHTYAHTHTYIGWWSRLDGEDCISMESLCSLEYEPFELRPGGEGDSPDPYNYFDGELAIHMCIYTCVCNSVSVCVHEPF